MCTVKLKTEVRRIKRYGWRSQSSCHSMTVRIFSETETAVFYSHPDARCPLFFSLSPCSKPLLLLLCPQIRSRNPNEIIFGLNDGYYAADFDHKVKLFCPFSRAPCIIMEYPGLIPLVYLHSLWLLHWHTAMLLLQDQSERKKNSLLQVDQSSVRNSYSVFSLLR